MVDERVLGVLGGMDIDDERLVAWTSSAQRVYAADSGADRLISLGFSPIVVGDFDSFASLPNASHLRLEQSLEQNTTDCDKLLALAKKDGVEAITMIATEGDLPDHVQATYSSCIASPLSIRFAFRRGIGWLLRAGDTVTIAAQEQQRVSLMPLLPCGGVVLQGVAWPLDNAELVPGGRVSISNEAMGETVVARIKDGAALLFLETSEVSW